MTPRSPLLLKFALTSNLLFSLACGVAALAASSSVAAMIGAAPWLVTLIGAGLIVFVVAIAAALRRLRILWALGIIALDILWVLVTTPLVVIPGVLTETGGALILGIAAFVALFAVLQLLGLRAMLVKQSANGLAYRHCIGLRSTADPSLLWPVIRDLGAISEFSDALSASRIENGAAVAPGAVRVCTDMNQRQWSEEVVTLDDEARSLTLRFRSEARDFPFPFATLTGGWRVAPHAEGGSDVEVWWRATPKPRWLGWLLFALMASQLDQMVPRIVTGMEARATGKTRPAARGGLALGYC